MAPQVQQQRIPEVAAESDILREQMEYLIAHSTGNAQCGCSACRRYERVRAALLEIFIEQPRSKVQEMAPRLARAA
jgi:hypothetical protein